MGKRKITLSNTVRDYRARANGMTQQELADRVGVTRQTVNAIEASKYSPSLEVAFLIARSLDARIEDIFSISTN
jgi:putative transcriptional regulator